MVGDLRENGRAKGLETATIFLHAIVVASAREFGVVMVKEVFGFGHGNAGLGVLLSCDVSVRNGSCGVVWRAAR